MNLKYMQMFHNIALKPKKTENSYMFLNKMVQQCSESEFNSQLKKWLIC